MDRRLDKTVFRDNLFTMFDDSDRTKKLRFQLSGITTGTARTLTIPDASGTICLLGSSPTFGNITAYAAAGNVAINVQTASAGVASLYLYGHKLGANATLAGIVFLNDEDNVAQINAYRYGGDDAADLIFKTQPTGGDVTTRLTISSTGNFDFESGNIETLGTLGAGAVTGTSFTTSGAGLFGVGGVGLYDGSQHLYLKVEGAILDEDMNLTLNVDDNFTMTLRGNAWLDDWFDQSVKIAASPTFAGETITGCSVLGLNSAVFQPTTDSTTFFQVLDADGGVPVLNVDSTNERVGIGTNAPNSIFHIKANTPGTVGSHPAGQLIIQDPDDTVFGNAVITGYESDGDGNPDQQLWYLGSSSGGDTDIIFLNRRNAKLALGTNGTSHITILGNGNVGIGTATPTFGKVEVYGNGADTTLAIHEDAGTHKAQLHLRSGGGDTKLYGLGADFFIDAESLAQAFTILTDGKVGIGEAAPQDKLEVNGTILVKDALKFTQDDGLEFIDSLADGYMDYRATTAHRFGDGTNQLLISNTGVVTMEGTARVLTGLWLGVNALKAPGTKPATFKEWGISGVWEFSDATDDTIVANIRVTDDMDRTVIPSFLIGWSTNTTVTTETAVWQLEYLYTSPGEDTTAAAQGTLTVNSNAVAQADGIIIAEITGMDLVSATDVCIHCRVKRLGADGNDDLTDTAELHGICLRYTKSKLGLAA